MSAPSRTSGGLNSLLASAREGDDVPGTTRTGEQSAPAPESYPAGPTGVCEGWTAARGERCGRPAKWRGTLTAGPQPEVRLFCGLHATTRMAGESWSFEWIGGAS